MLLNYCERRKAIIKLMNINNKLDETATVGIEKLERLFVLC